MINYLNKKALTLLELIIVMGITATLMGLGVVGVVNFRNTIEFQNGYADLVSIIKTTQNKARNAIVNANAASGGEFIDGSPDYYVISLVNDEISSLACYNSGTTALSCTEDELDIQSDRFSNITFTSNCSYIAFQKRANNIVKLSESFVISDNGSCVLNVSHKNVTGKSKKITLDLVTNSIESE